MTLIPDQPSLVLAPMDGVTDPLMRGLLTEKFPFTHCVSEFVRVNATAPSKKVFLHDIPELTTNCVTAAGTPVHVQILGGIPEVMAEAALTASQLGASVIDINFGCPAPTVNRHDGGATLLRYPERIEQIVAAVRAVVPAAVPVSAKLRLGWDDPTAIIENATRAARGGAAWITIHGRTKFQGYTPPAYWKPIGEVRRSLAIPVVANGEIWTVDDLRRCQDETGCIHFMLGRGVLAEPSLVGACAKHLRISHSTPTFPVLGDSPKAWSALLDELVKRSQEVGESERRSLSRIKQWLNYASKKGQISWFNSVKRLSTLAEVNLVLRELSLTFSP